MVLQGDPTLMFTNAGMNQFKDIILGNAPRKYPRVTDSQKCLRVSGKHNDLSAVGHDTYHHTMFEMLGNWSFGDYFKQEIIPWAWELLTEVYGLPKDRLYVTIFEGAPQEGLERDQEAYDAWAKLLPEERILNGNKHDNFWEMGETGPCGPCSEIHIDLRSEEEIARIPGRDLVNQDDPLVIEIWNLVFMEYNRMADGHLEALPHHVIDTGMGLERLCMAMQGKKSNYDTDVFQPLIGKVAEISGVAYGSSEKTDVAMRVIADHIRAIAFAITDGQLPSSTRAGYVIRRILRRAVRYGYTFLNLKEPFMYLLIPTLVESMGGHYTELVAQQELITRVTKQEESAFLRTLSTGIEMLQSHIDESKKKGEKTLPGEIIFELYDTYGFPADLTELILEEQGMEADLQGFDSEMAKQKERARKAQHTETGDWQWIGDQETETTFVGYEMHEAQTRIVRYRQVTQNGKKSYQVVLETTPFYAEMGGQVGDTGTLIGEEDQERIKVLDTIQENNLPMLLVDKLPIDPHQDFLASIDSERRYNIERNHTATHLLDHALRTLFGDTTEQKGSLVSDRVLRYDFAHFEKMTKEEIREVERMVNEAIQSDYQRIEHRDVPISKAKEMGAIALFGEKYGDYVRVMQFGDSIELCGGCHAPSTGVLGSFHITQETSVAAGVRRIFAVTGPAALDYVHELEDTIETVKSYFGGGNLISAIKKVLEENHTLSAEVKQAYDREKGSLISRLQKHYELVDGVKVIRPDVAIPSALAKDIAFGLKQVLDGDYVFVSGSKDEGKALLTVLISDGLVEKGYNAGKLVKAAGQFIQGGGGGQPSLATAGGKRPEGLPEAVDFVLGELGLKKE